MKELCADCCMINKTHSQHIIVKIEQLYNDNLTEIKKTISDLQNKANQYEKLITSVKIIKESVDEYIDDKIKEIKAMYEESKKEIFIKGSEINDKLSTCENELLEKKKKVENTKNDLLKTIETSSKTEIIKKYKELIINHSIDESIDSKVYNNIINLDIAYEIAKEIQPQYEHYCNIIYDLNNKKQIEKEFNYYGLRFICSVNYNEQFKSLNTFMHLVSNSNTLNQINLAFKIEVKHKKIKNISKENIHLFKLGDCIGYNSFTSLNAQLNEIKVVFTVKPITYKMLSILIENYYKNNNKSFNKENKNEDVININKNVIDLSKKDYNNELRVLSEELKIKDNNKKHNEIKESIKDDDLKFDNLGVSFIKLNTKIDVNEPSYIGEDLFDNTHNNKNKKINAQYKGDSIYLFPKNPLNTINVNVPPKVNSSKNVFNSQTSSLLTVYPENSFNFKKK